MSTPLRIGGFVAILALVFGAAFGIGRVFDDEPPTYAMKLAAATAQPGSQQVSFRIEDDGEPVTEFDVRHEKKLHLIAVTHDFTNFQHVHPTMSRDGSWSSDLELSPGAWRLYGDYQPAGGTNRVSYADLQVSADGRPPGSPAVPMPGAPAMVDGYEITVSGDLTAGGEGSMLEFRVTKAGRPVTLQPYLGAFGHLVVLRGTDMKYLHVHPEEGPAGSAVSFHAEAPTAGTYHLYLDFKHGDVVRTATFVLKASKAAGGHDEMGGMDNGDH